jgi:hypothetical protein
MRVNFIYSPEKDANNYLKFVRDFPEEIGASNDEIKLVRARLDKTLVNKLQIAKKEDARRLALSWVKKVWEEKKGRYLNEIEMLKQQWKPRENGFIQRLEDFYNASFTFNKLTAYLTTLPICPYDYKAGWFMVSLLASTEHKIRTVGHELMHFMFIKHYWKYCREKLKLDDKQIDIIKEALTVYLNTEFSEWIKVEDKGHKREQKLRSELVNFHPKTENFKQILQLVVQRL